MIKYECKTRAFSGRWIRAGLEYLNALELFPEMELEPGDWIWPQAYVREHMNRVFFLEQDVRQAKMEFWCDNLIDVYINGKLISSEKNATGVIDITDELKKGKNIVAIRAYQTNSPLYFTSALRGSIQMIQSDGTAFCVKTDKEWHAYEVSDFFAAEEPQNWFLMDHPGRENRDERTIVCTKIHPRLLRRSCYFKKEVTVSDSFVCAKLYATAKGFYEVYVNGEKADDSVFSPGSIEEYKEYQIVDISCLLHKGCNVITFLTGNGWANCSSWGELRAESPAVLGELEISYENGKKEVVVTDESWITAVSPWVDNDIQFGERYDARLERSDWDKKQYENQEGWYPAEIVDDELDKLILVYQDYPPIRKKRPLEALEKKQISGNCTLYDFGKNIAGRCRILLKNCKKGEIIKIQYCERLNRDGMPCIGPYVDVFFPYDSFPDGKASYSRRNMDIYICKGEEQECYEPKFTYTGFRYIYVESDNAEVVKIESVPIHTDLNEAGNIITDYPLIEEIWDRITRSYRSNILSGPTDCPTREKNFWNGDIQVFVHTACWYMDNSKFLSRWTDGGRKIEKDVYGWEDEEYILPLALYQFYGDIEIVRTKYPVAKELLAERQRKMQGKLPLGMRSPYRDQLAVDNGMSSDFFACCYYCYSLKMLSKMADILGEEKECVFFQLQFSEARKEFLRLYYNYDNGDLGQACQGAQILPLAFGLILEQEQNKVMNRLLYYINKANNHLSTGFMATEFLLGLLCDYGHADVAWKIFTQKDFPSWQHIIDTGATTMTEDWFGNTSEDPWLSMNHYALGNVGRWFFEYLGGIRVDDSEPGFEKIVFKPLFVREIGNYKVCYHSIKGNIESLWCFEGDEVLWNIIIPSGTVAEVILPNGNFICKNSCKFEFRIETKIDNRQVI